MSIIVQKYGGSSVATPDRIKSVARRIADRKDTGDGVVVVVSAMGDSTDTLTVLADQLTDAPPPREMDMLLSTGEIVSTALLTMALKAIGYDAIGLDGNQAGIQTTREHRRAQIQEIDPSRIHENLETGKIVVVAGFQGISEGLDITTVGRGGSDTTAVALAAKLGADVCEIYTDVEGVYTADPRIEPKARQLIELNFEEMAELANHGARVLHSRAVELAWVYNVPILVASSFTEKQGTLIHGGRNMEMKDKVKGIAHDLDVTKVTILGVPDHPGIAASIFSPLSDAGISVDIIVQNSSVDKLTDLSFTVERSSLDEALAVINPITKTIGASSLTSNTNLAKVSVVGAGMQSQPGYASTMFECLNKVGVNIEMITTSEIRITCIIHEEGVQKAIRALHSAFELEADIEES
ncbi:MAG: aspartate kinase [SAR202 cluster bacterium]|nr:aspartate kinase [SAR202 cluster bacterium]